MTAVVPVSGRNGTRADVRLGGHGRRGRVVEIYRLNFGVGKRRQLDRCF